MKLYATVASERATKGQGGNDFIENKIFTTNRETPSHRLRVFYDESIGEINIVFQARHFETWRDLATDKIFIEATEKGEKQKGENYLFESTDKTIKRIKSEW